MKRAALFALTGLSLMAGGCTASLGGGSGVPRGVDVTRYHLGEPVVPGSVTIEPLATNATISPEYRTYADAVGHELSRLGFTPTPAVVPATPSQYIAAVSFTRAARGTIQKRPPVSIGLGGGGFSGGRRGGGIGLGGGISTGIGGGTREVIVSELAVQLRRRTDGTVVWEGGAQTANISRTREAQPVDTARRLASALFKGFPGESGITITVP